MGVTRYLADKSALARLHLPAVREELEPLITRALVGICGVTELEMLYSARNIQERARTSADRLLGSARVPGGEEPPGTRAMLQLVLR